MLIGPEKLLPELANNNLPDPYLVRPVIPVIFCSVESVITFPLTVIEAGGTIVASLIYK